MRRLIGLALAGLSCFFMLVSVGRGEEEILHGQIQAINKKFDFVIIDIGSENGVKEGMVFMVHRKKKLLGKVRVEEAYPRMSSCLNLPAWQQGKFREDDGVILE